MNWGNSRQKHTRRNILALAIGATTIGLVSSCMPKPSVPAERLVSFGFEDVVTDTPRWAYFGEQLRRSNANAIAISVGRTDWAAFPWPKHPDSVSSNVSQTGKDYVEEAIKSLRPHLSGKQWLTLTIDTLAPALLTAKPALAGVNPAGAKSTSFPSVSALATGEAGDRIVDLAMEICSRYKPDRISLTELMFDDYTFGDEDLTSYENHTGRRDWPRASNGQIDTQDPSLGAWRSTSLATLLARVKTVAAVHGTELDMDVRTSWAEPGQGRPLSGHDYPLLLSESDRIIVWNYFAINGSTPEYAGQVGASLKERFPGRFVMSTGLWAQDGAVTARQLESSLAAVARAQVEAVSVTPASMLTDAHWDVLAGLWKP